MINNSRGGCAFGVYKYAFCGRITALFTVRAGVHHAYGKLRSPDIRNMLCAGVCKRVLTWHPSVRKCAVRICAPPALFCMVKIIPYGTFCSAVGLYRSPRMFTLRSLPPRFGLRPVHIPHRTAPLSAVPTITHRILNHTAALCPSCAVYIYASRPAQFISVSPPAQFIYDVRPAWSVSAVRCSTYPQPVLRSSSPVYDPCGLWPLCGQRSLYPPCVLRNLYPPCGRTVRSRRVAGAVYAMWPAQFISAVRPAQFTSVIRPAQFASAICTPQFISAMRTRSS